MAVYPTFEEVVAGEDKNKLLEVRRSFFSVLSSLTLFFVLVIVVYSLNVAFGDWRVPKSIPVLHHISLRWLSLVPALVLLEVLRKYHDDLYVFAMHKITHHQGRLSLRHTLPSLKYVDILAVRVKQDIWGRIFNYGNVELDTAATSGVELTMSGVRAPREIAEIVDQMRRRSLDKGAVEDRHQAKHQTGEAAPSDDLTGKPYPP